MDTGTGKPVVDAGGIGDAITLSADGITLEGFEATNVTNGAGIRIESSNNTLTNNIANLNTYYGIYMESSNNNTLTNNIANSNKGDGIWMPSSSNNTFTNNTANSNSHEGIHLSSSNNNMFTNNTANSNYAGIWMHSSNNNTLTNNTLNSNYQSGIHMSPASNNVFANNTANSNEYCGIWMHYSINNLFTNNNVSGNDKGIYLSSSSNNMFMNNAISGNDYGIYRCTHNDLSSSNNLIYNNYFANTNNTGDDLTNNIWNITKTIGTNIVGGPYLGGNYWSDYIGEDLDGDGLGDTLLPHSLGDWHPLLTLDTSPDRLVAEWHFDEGSGSVVHDSSRCGNDGAIHGATWVDGRIGQALEFGGMNDYVEVPHSTSLDITDEITLEAWIKPNIINNYHTILSKYQSIGYYLRIDPDGTIAFSASGTLETDHAVPVGSWSYITGVSNGTYETIYLNGQLIKSGQIAYPSGNIGTVDKPLTIGSFSEGLLPFNGTIDKVRIHNRCLSAEEIWQSYEEVVSNEPPIADTPVGTDVGVELVEVGIDITFDEVTEGGQTSVTVSANGTPPPSGFNLAGRHYNITTTASYAGSTTICINYDESLADDENSLKLFHYEDGNWIDVTTSLDTTENIICGAVTSFSEFIVAEPIGLTPPPVPEAPSMILVGIGLLATILLVRGRRRE
jgi:parallel beta-helix repeat protein